MWQGNQIAVKLTRGFKVSLPEFILYDSKDILVELDYCSKRILLTLIMNGFVPDEELKLIAKSYKTIICRLKKCSSAHGFQIKRLRKKGYQLGVLI